MPNHAAAATQLADMIINIADPKVTRWHKEQMEILARQAAKNYLKKVEKK